MLETIKDDRKPNLMIGNGILMANDNGDNNGEKKDNVFGRLFQKAKNLFSKKKHDKLQDDVDDQEFEYIESEDKDNGKDQEFTDDFSPAFNRLEEIQDESESDEIRPSLKQGADDTKPAFDNLAFNESHQEDDDSTKPSFQITDFSDEENEADIEKTLNNINLQEKGFTQESEQTGIHKLKSSLGGIFKKRPLLPLHQGDESSSKTSFISRLILKFKSRKSGHREESKASVNLYQNLFSPNTRPAIHRVFILLLFIGSALLTARLITTILTPKVEVVRVAALPSQPRIDTKNLNNSLASLERNDVFKAKVLVPTAKPKKKDPIVDQELVCKEAKRKSSLSMKLTKTIVLQDSVKSIASVQVRGKDSHLRIGDRIPGMAEIGNIDGGKIFFKNLKSGLCEYVEAPKKDTGKRKSFQVEKNLKKGRKLIANSKKTGIKNDGNTYKIKKSVRDKNGKSQRGHGPYGKT